MKSTHWQRKKKKPDALTENVTLWHSLSGSSEGINETEPRDIEENTRYDPFDNGPRHSWVAQSITWEGEKAGVKEQDSLALPSCSDSNGLL